MNFKQFLDELYKPKQLKKLRQTLKKKVTDVDARDPSWQFTLNDIMAAYDFKKLGAGKYASVFGNKKYPYVIKVFMKDSAYIRWISFCLKNKTNPYVPKIKGKVVKVTDLVYAIRLEKLEPFSRVQGSEFMSHYYKWQNDPKYKSGDKDLDSVFEHFSKNKKLLDLHGENLMMRGKQVVVIDPYYNWFNKHKPMDYTIDPHEVDISIF